MKKYLLLAAVLFSTTAIFAQTSTVKGNLIDSYYEEGIIGSIVELAPLNSSKAPTLTTSGHEGSFTFNSIPYGDYLIKTSFVGYEDYVDTIKINSPRLLLDKIRVKESSTEIDAVVKEVQAMRTSQHGDTLSYNAGAYKVADDADVEGLLKKMPGITISDDGEVSAQGETVQKIFVDGREFFGSDVTTAISTLPAEMVDNIEVYDKLSDNAELSGMDDGEGYKAINIVTKKEMREGFFGKMYVGTGYQPEVEGDFSKIKYMSGGNVNYFTGNHRFSVIALLNNINQQNFSFDDILGVSDSGSSASEYMVRPQSGIAEVAAIGLNYSGSYGTNDKVKVEASYFYNGTTTQNTKVVDKWYEDPSAIDTLNSVTTSYTPNYNHRINGRVEWKITPSQQLTLRQSASFQYNDAESATVGSMWGESGYSLLDSYSLGDKGGYNSSTSLSYVSRLGKAGRTITVNGNLSLREQDNISYNYSNGASGYTDSSVIAADTALLMTLYPDMLRDLYYTTVFSPTSTVTVSGNATYAEPVGKFSRVTLKYSYSNKNQDTEKRTYLTDDSYYVEEGNLQTASSNSYNTLYVTHQIGPGFYYANGKNKLSANVNYQYSELTGDVVLAGADQVSEPIEHQFKNITYSMMAQAYITPTNSLRFNLSSKTSEPWVGRLVDAYSLSNVQYISHGNPDLVPSYTTSARMFFVHSNVEKGSTFMMMGGVEHQNDYMGEHLVYYPDSFEVDGVTYDPIEYSTYVNLDNYWSLRGMIEYGFPISPLKSNFNVRGGINYKLTPSMFGGTVDAETGMIEGGELNNTESMTYSFNAVLGSNISQNVDFTLSWNGEYSEATNSASTSNDVNTYLSQTASASMKFVFLGGFTFTGSATYKEYVGITNDYQESYVLCNAFIGKKIFRNQRGELNLGVNDILNQNTSFSRTVGTGYTQNSYNSVIGRYYSVQLVYNLRSFGNQKSGDGERRGPGMGGPGGMRGMGGGPGRM
ncbi:MAG: outer membrane beta-barrel protein [Rikenellaceae bacterium]